MKLRKLKETDAAAMLEWMHDPFVVGKMKTDFGSKTVYECINFINSSRTSQNIHMAIVNDGDMYMGTVSLKHIENDEAEFAVTVRKEAMGQGYSIFGMKEIIRYGFENLKLRRIYWCVSPSNIRAIKFYNKNGYQICAKPQISKYYDKSQIDELIWYSCDNII